MDGDIEVLDELIKRGYNPAVDMGLALLYASDQVNLPMVNRLLQDKRIDPATKNNYIIRSASKKGQIPVVRRLLQEERVRNSLSTADYQKLTY